MNPCVIRASHESRKAREPHKPHAPRGTDATEATDATDSTGPTLARLFLKDPDLVILDEVTSSMDERTAESVYLEVLEKYKSKMIIIISHSPFVEKFATRVFKVENKRLVESYLNKKSGIRESDPLQKLGKLLHYRCANAALPIGSLE